MILLPHGGYPLIAATLSTMAWMTTVSHDGCDFARLTGPATKTLTFPNDYPFVELGFSSYRVPVFYEEYNEWLIRYSDACHPYDMIGQTETGQGDEWSFDFFWRCGSATHQIGIALGGAACLFLWVAATCVAITRLHWRLLGFQLALAAFFHLCSFLWFFNGLCYTEDTECFWFYGSNSSLAAFSLYIISFVSIFLKYPEPMVVKIVRGKVEAEFQTYEYTESILPPSEFDEASGIHSSSGFSGNSFNNRQRSQRDLVL